MSLKMIILTVFLCGLIVFFERAFPFILFSKKNPPKIIDFIQKLIPPMVMGALVIYCLKDITFFSENQFSIKGFLPQILALTVTIVLHLIKRNTLLSILSGTVLYMILIHIL